MVGPQAIRKSLLAIAAAVVFMGSTVAANALLITGTYTVTSTGSPTITNLLASPFSTNLVLGVPQTFDLANIFQTAAGETVVTASFNFTVPTAGSGNVPADDVFKLEGKSAHDELIWQSAGLIVVNFLNSAILNITLGDQVYNGAAKNYTGLTVPVTFTLVQDAAAIPEPGSLALLGAGLGFLAAGALVRRRRKKRFAEA